MKTRKLALLIADAVLLLVCIIQFVVKGQSNVKSFTVKADIDSISIVNGLETINITKKNDAWFIGDKEYPASNNSVTELINKLSSFDALEKIASTSNEANLEKYELLDGKKIEVTAKAGEKIVRTIQIGKQASTGSQSYATVDNGKDIYLLSSDLRSVFNKSVSDLREMVVFTLEKSEITSVDAVLSDSRTVKFTKESQIEDFTAEQIAQTLENFATVTATKWYDGKMDLGGELVASTKINTASKTVAMDVYKIPAVDENSSDTYYANCSESPYTFEFAGYNATRFEKLAEVK